MRKQLWISFVAAFVLNFFWEHIHSGLYLHYRGGEITVVLLTFMAVKDAVIITALIAAQRSFAFAKNKPWLIPLAALVISVAVEWHALATGRWAYAEAMPIVPLLGTGLSPTVQLALTSYLVSRISLYTKKT